MTFVDVRNNSMLKKRMRVNDTHHTHTHSSRPHTHRAAAETIPSQLPA